MGLLCFGTFLTTRKRPYNEPFRTTKKQNFVLENTSSDKTLSEECQRPQNHLCTKCGCLVGSWWQGDKKTDNRVADRHILGVAPATYPLSPNPFCNHVKSCVLFGYYYLLASYQHFV